MIEQDLRGQILLNAGVITAGQLEKALQLQKQSGRKIGEILIEAGFVTEDQMLLVLERQFGIPWMKLRVADVDGQAVRLVPSDVVKNYELCPVRDEDGVLTVAIADPLSYEVLDEVRLALQREIAPILVSGTMLAKCVEHFYHIPASEFLRAKKMVPVSSSGVAEVSVEESDGAEASVAVEAPSVVSSIPAETVQMWEELLADVWQEGVSDFYVEKRKDRAAIRYRLDGVLCSLEKLENAQRAQAVANLLIANKSALHEGSGTQTCIWEDESKGQKIRLRISALQRQGDWDFYIKVIRPLRDFGKNGVQEAVVLKELGMAEDVAACVTLFLKQRGGLLWVLSDTDGGVSTTLRTFMSQLSAQQRKVLSFESHIELPLPHVQQWECLSEDAVRKEGRYLLQMRPDVVVIDGLEQEGVAQVMLDAVMKGIMVIVGLNVKHFQGVLLKMKQLGMRAEEVINMSDIILQQALVRCACSGCARLGCERCHHTGYLGRTGMFQCVSLDDEMREWLRRDAGETMIRKIADRQGRIILAEQGRRLVKKCVTTTEELQRVGLA